MSANLYKGTGSRIAQGISSAGAGTISGVVGAVAILPITGRWQPRDVTCPSIVGLLSFSLCRPEEKKNLCADPVADIKMQAVRACASLFIRLDIGVLWTTALCVPQ